MEFRLYYLCIILLAAVSLMLPTIYSFKQSFGRRIELVTRRLNRPCFMSTSGSSPAFNILLTAQLCGGSVVVMKCPTPSNFKFEKDMCTSGSISEINLGVDVPSSATAALQEELEFGFAKEQSKDTRINVFMGGRLALRTAIGRISQANTIDNNIPTTNICGALLSNSLGAPVCPVGITGSISHKGQLAVAAAAPSQTSLTRTEEGHIGVDIEKCTNSAHEKLRKRLLTETEQGSLDGISGSCTIEEEVMLRFSLKEAIYKAVNPHLKRYVQFTEAEVFPHTDGTANVRFKLETGEKFKAQAEWRRFNNDHWITCVYAWPDQ